MSIVVIVGLAWGDESKGKVVDLLANKANIVARWSGGNNAGHSLAAGDKKIITHLIPSGVMHEGVVCVLGEGMVIDPIELLSELEACNKLGFTPQLMISKSAHVVMPYHKELDALREGSTNVIGTTRKGIGPAYESKMARFGIRMIDLLDVSLVRKLTTQHVMQHNLKLDIESIVYNFCAAGQKLVSMFADTSKFINKAIDEDKNIVLEGAQAAMLDIDHGIYPYVSSSSGTSGGACAALGIGPSKIDCVIGVSKVYCTQVGAGVFPTRMDKATEDAWRKEGNEYGATTGRPRKCGWLDVPALKRALRINGVDFISWHKLDVLFKMPNPKICLGYEINGEFTDEFPTDPNDLKRAVPILENIPTFSGGRKEVELIEYLTKLVGVPACLYSTGPKREETTVLYNPFDK